MKNKKHATQLYLIAMALFVVVIISFTLSKFPFDATESTKTFWGIICGVTSVVAIIFLKYKNNYIKINDLFKKKK